MATSTAQKPLRTALIGLSANAVTSWAAGAHLPNFLTAAGKQRFQITALLNSSVGAAEAAIKKYDFPASTKAYGDPNELAKDPDIDFIVTNTRVDLHYETSLASIKAGKNAFIEWPVASNPQQIGALVAAAKESGAKVAIGLQRRWAPQVIKLREIVQSGRLGKILSSEVTAYGGTVDRETLSAGLSYFTDRKIGGNAIVIGVGHLIDFVQSVVGEFDPDNTHARSELIRPNVLLKDSKTGQIVDTVRSNVPDLLAVNGRLKSDHAADNATLSFSFRRGQSFPGTPPLDWRINFEKGEVRLVSPSGLSLGAADTDEPPTIQLHDYQTDKVEDIAYDWTDEQNEVPLRARPIQTTIYAFADGVPAGEGWVSIEDAARRAEQIEGWLKASGW